MDARRLTPVSRRSALAGLGLAGICLASSARSGLFAAHQATPPAGTGIATMEIVPGITRELFAAVPTARAEGHTLYQARFTFNPGAEIFPHGHPGSVLLSVSSGTFGWTLFEGVAHVVRGPASGVPETPEDFSMPGDDVILYPGDAIYYEDDVVHTARGAGDEPAIVLGALLLTAGEPFLMPADMEMGGNSPANQ